LVLGGLGLKFQGIQFSMKGQRIESVWVQKRKGHKGSYPHWYMTICEMLLRASFK
jgi:hypothetical protein